MPSVLAALSATANYTAVNTSPATITRSNGSNTETIVCTNNLKSNGFRERTGAGILDVTALLNYSTAFLNTTINFNSLNFVELKEIYLSAGQTVRVACAWQRDATRTINKFLGIEISRTYSKEPMADIDLFLYNSNDTPVESSVSGNANVEIITYTVTSSGYYRILVQPFDNYGYSHCLNYAYVIK